MLKEMPKVGDKVKVINSVECPDINGKVGEVIVFPNVLFAHRSFRVGIPSKMYGKYTYVDAYVDDIELIEEAQPTPDTASLIANLALRVGELELQNAQQAHEINELYRADAERGVLR